MHSGDVLRLVMKIPKGKVTTYKAIANALGTKAYRAVGRALKENKNPVVIPCHRVVCSSGHLGGYAGEINSMKKVTLLRDEGVFMFNGKIVDFENVMFKKFK